MILTRQHLKEFFTQQAITFQKSASTKHMSSKQLASGVDHDYY